MTTSMIEIGNIHRPGEYVSGRDRALFIWSDDEPVFGFPSEWSDDKVRAMAAEKALDAEVVISALRAFREELNARLAARERAAAEMDRRERVILAEARQAIEHDRLIRVRQACNHAAVSTRTTCYMGGADNPAAAGGITEIDTCRCGATRYSHINGLHEDIGGWIA